MLNLDQYANPNIKLLYRDAVAPAILDTFGDFSMLVAPIGTGGTLIGLSEGFRSRLGITCVGAMCAPDQEIPGMRDVKGMEEVKQPWQKALAGDLDQRIEVERRAAFLCAPWINRLTGVPAGASGGAAYIAGCRAIQRCIEKGTLDSIRDKKTGKIKMLIVIHDDVGPYLADRFTTEFRMEDFHPSTATPPQQLIFGY